MTRSFSRACLQEGLSLNLNDLIRAGLVERAGWTAPRPIRWTLVGFGDEVASGKIAAGMERDMGWLQIEVGADSQCLTLRRLPRHYGGGQWYFVCPVTGRLCSTVWRPPGATRFAARQAWRNAAYTSQMQTPLARALTQGHALRYRLGGLTHAGYGVADPPKPKGMRWRTYERLLERARRYQRIAYRAQGFKVQEPS